MNYKGKGLYITGYVVLLAGIGLIIVGIVNLIETSSYMATTEYCGCCNMGKCYILAGMFFGYGIFICIMSLCWLVPGVNKRGMFKDGIISREEARFIDKVRNRIGILEESIKRREEEGKNPGVLRKRKERLERILAKKARFLVLDEINEFLRVNKQKVNKYQFQQIQDRYTKSMKIALAAHKAKDYPKALKYYGECKQILLENVVFPRRGKRLVKIKHRMSIIEKKGGTLESTRIEEKNYEKRICKAGSAISFNRDLHEEDGDAPLMNSG
ncbi:MAG: hypothetical protein ACFFCS_15410 [Candidatus Hodarchaeota archaeon]